jgi:hypothetical protein
MRRTRAPVAVIAGGLLLSAVGSASADRCNRNGYDRYQYSGSHRYYPATWNDRYEWTPSDRQIWPRPLDLAFSIRPHEHLLISSPDPRFPVLDTFPARSPAGGVEVPRRRRATLMCVSFGVRELAITFATPVCDGYPACSRRNSNRSHVPRTGLKASAASCLTQAGASSTHSKVNAHGWPPLPMRKASAVRQPRPTWAQNPGPHPGEGRRKVNLGGTRRTQSVHERHEGERAAVWRSGRGIDGPWSSAKSSRRRPASMRRR